MILTIILFAFSAVILYFIALAPKEKRFEIAGNSQGTYLSQTMFNILRFQNPDYSDAYFEQSVPFNKRGEYAKGFQLLDKAVELEPLKHLGLPRLA
ncbi:hypothetical protein [uncultured Maribacter sp.]|uniref:hypothetical protein n=1 Tax=uncultured Maribacter sp. TaxID=431308 RepID=UPI002607BB5B|nr:hypothetical protein [uncultured Maribacter sp.]